MSSQDGPIVFFSLFALFCAFWSYSFWDDVFPAYRVSAIATLLGFVASASAAGFFMAISKPTPKAKKVEPVQVDARQYQ